MVVDITRHFVTYIHGDTTPETHAYVTHSFSNNPSFETHLLVPSSKKASGCGCHLKAPRLLPTNARRLRKLMYLASRRGLITGAACGMRWPSYSCRFGRRHHGVDTPLTFCRRVVVVHGEPRAIKAAVVDGCNNTRHPKCKVYECLLYLQKTWRD